MAAQAPATEARVGILGCGTIGRKNARAILRARGVRLAAVASRDLDRCRCWCDELRLPASVQRLGSYEAILAADIDIVYVALPTSLHAEWVTRAAAAGRHVLVEKPVARSAEEAREMILACRASGVQLMDGLMFAHHARWQKLLAIFEDPFTWQPVRVTAAFTFRATPDYLASNIRVRPDGDPLGCLGDLGWYLIRVGLAAFRWEKPLSASTRVHAANAAGIPLDADVDLRWPPAAEALPSWASASSAGDGRDGEHPSGAEPVVERLMTFHCSFLHPWRQWYEAVSTNGKVVRCRDLCIPQREQICEFEIEQAIGTTEVDCVSLADRAVVPTLDCAQEVCMWERMGSIAVGGKPEPCFEEQIFLTQLVLDAVMASSRDGGRAVAVENSSL